MDLSGTRRGQDLATRTAALAALLLLAGCAAEPVRRHGTPFPGRIVLLPLANQSSNLQAPILARHLLTQHLTPVIGGQRPAADVDATLRGLGVTDGGQLAALDPAKLGAALGADALLEGEIRTFSYTNVGVLYRRKVEIALRLVDATTGTVLWESSRAESTTRAALDREAIERNFAVGLGEKLIEGALKSPLRPECETVCVRLARDLSRARGRW